MGESGAVVLRVEDITDRHGVEAQLMQSEKLAAVGRLVSGVAHELNNPLTSIAGLAEFLQDRPAIPAAEREHLRVIHEEAERASRIVRNLLNFAHRTTTETATVDLHDIVERTALLVDYSLRLQHVTLTRSLAAEPLAVQANRDELQQVLINLITNAGQALRALPAGAPRQIILRSERAGNQAVVRVQDTGPGVPAGLVPRLFTPFFTTKEPGEGTGLGLWISHRILEARGGRLAYRAAPGGGAEFWFALPIAPVR
jgi:two-component system NtrC family sensor kinase